MLNEPDDKTKTAIWLTSRSRMNAEKRFRRYDNTCHVLLCWLSLSVIGWAVVRNLIPSTATLDVYTSIVSVFVFAFSIVVFSFRFGETATQHRECYLRLQKLHDADVTPEERKRQYHETLSGYGNHSDWDYDSLVLDRTLFGKRELWGQDGKPILWTWLMLTKHIFFVGLFWISSIGIFLLGMGTFVLIFLELR